MAKYTGSWAKGFASTFNPVAGINLGLQWKEKKKAQKKIDDAIEQLKNDSMELAAKFDKARADKIITQQEFGDAMAWAIPLGKEISGRTETLYKNFMDMTPEQLDIELANIKAILDFSEGLDFTNLEQMKEFGNKLTQPNAKMQWDLVIKSIEGRDKPMRAEAFPTAEEVMEKYPKAGYKYTEEGYVPTFQEPTAPKVPSAADRKFDMAMKIYEKNGNLDMLLKYLGMYIAPPKKSALKEKLDEMTKLGATTEEKKKWILSQGGGGGTLTPTAPSVENVREDIKKAPTIEDAKRIEKNHIAKYGDTLGIPNVDKFWSDERVNRLTSLKQGIDKLLDEKKRLKKGTVTSADVGFEIEDDIQKVEVVYQQLREEYMKYRKLLEKMGVDLSQFPELMPYEEYLKADIKPDSWKPNTWFKQKPPIY